MAIINVNNLEYVLQNAGFPKEVVGSVRDIPNIHDRFLVDRDEAAKFLYFKGLEQKNNTLVSEFKRASTIAGNFQEVSAPASQHSTQIENVELADSMPLASVLSDEYKVCASNFGTPFPDHFSFYRSDDFQACVQHCRNNVGHLLKECERVDIYTKDGEWVGGYRAGPAGIIESMQRSDGHFEQTATIPFDRELESDNRDSIQEQSMDISETKNAKDVGIDEER